jgi:superfamily II DNA or RNA helicase
VQLREYQRALIQEIRDVIRAGKRRILVQLPTGGGKTLTAAAMLAGAVEKGNRSLFAAHRLELIDQTVATFARIGVLSIGVVRSQDRRADPSQPIQVCSIQTLARRAPLRDIRIVFIDEAHRSLSKSYVKHLFEAYPEAVFVGLSATPCRTDEKPLDKFWEFLINGPRYSLLIAEGHLAAPETYGAPVLPDLATVRTEKGDYNAEDLEEAVNKRALIGNLLEEWQRRSGGRRTVAFAVSIAHSRAIVDAFRSAGVAAEHLDGETDETERRAILGRLESGQTQLVSNVGVLCEGWDMPACKCLLLARPTKSLALYMQMGGRILRPWEGVTPIIIDHGGNVDRHGWVHEDREWSLESRPKKVNAANLKACPQCFAMIRSTLSECPLCGHAFGEGPGDSECEAKEELTHVELALRTLPDPSTDERAAFFAGLLKTAKERGWMPGALNHRFREKFGELPPKDWYVRAKRALRKDAGDRIPEAWQ